MKLIEPLIITAEYKISTPMFLGGAFNEVTGRHVANKFIPEMRNASLKGALRFWWRALNWGPIWASCNGQEAEALKKLHKEEGQLFGHASGQSGSQSLLQLRSCLSADSGCTDKGQSPNTNFPAYLLGQGLCEKGKTTRSYISGSLTLKLHLNPRITQAQIDSVVQAATALGLFGGLGSRARRGFGSLSLQRIESTNGSPRNFRNLEDIRGFLGSLNFQAHDKAPLSAFTKSTRIVAVEEQNLAIFSEALQKYRDGGTKSERENQPRGEQRLNFPKDRELASQALKGERIDQLPKRAVFGLPHNYFWRVDKKLDIASKDEQRNRRASPLLTHIHEFPSGKRVAIHSFLATRFLPDDTEIKLDAVDEAKQHSQVVKVTEMDDSVIHTFLNQLTGEELRHA